MSGTLNHRGCSERESRILWQQDSGWRTAGRSCWHSMHSLEMSFCLLSCPRANARDSEGFLENDLARKLCECCHGHQPGGSGQGKVPLPVCKARAGLGLTQSCCSGELSSKMPFASCSKETNSATLGFSVKCWIL